MQFALRISDQALPYLATVCIGILGGHYIEHYKNREISPMVTKICWSLIGLVSFIIVFGKRIIFVLISTILCTMLKINIIGQRQMGNSNDVLYIMLDKI